MIELVIEDQKAFTEGLFINDMFDGLLIRDAEIVTYNKFSIDGSTRRAFFSEEEIEENGIEEYSRWSVIKPFCYSLIKGKRLPQSFKFVFLPDRAATENFTEEFGTGIDAENVTGLYLNIQYEDHEMVCITGTSLSIFTLDKSFDRAWDEYVIGFFKDKGIAVTVEE